MSTIHPLSFGFLQIVKLMMIFFAIISLIVIAAYFLKKFNMVSWTKGPIKLLTGLSLSTKERIILIDVGGKQILLGVCPAGIQMLHAFDEIVVPVEKKEDQQNNKKIFQSLINKCMSDEKV